MIRSEGVKVRQSRVMLQQKPADPYTSLEAGDTGTLVNMDLASRIAEVNWDNGSKLSVSFDDIVGIED